MAVPGFLLLGVLCDRFTGRRLLPWVLIVLAAGVLLLLGTRNSQTSSIFLVLFLLCYGLTAGVTTAVIPVVLVESLGLRRFGSISGLVGLAGRSGSPAGRWLSWAISALVIRTNLNRKLHFSFRSYSHEHETQYKRVQAIGTVLLNRNCKASAYLPVDASSTMHPDCETDDPLAQMDGQVKKRPSPNKSPQKAWFELNVRFVSARRGCVRPGWA